MTQEIAPSFSISLPPELERLIFETVYEYGRGYVPKLLLVARRVYEWVRPMLYRIIIQFVDHETLPTRNVPPSSGNTPLDSVCPFARHLLVGGPLKEEEICQIFEASPNVVDLCIWSELPLKKFIHYIHRLCPLRLSVDLAGLDLDDFTGPAFSRVTHLDAVGWKGQPWRVWKNVTLLPKLTHLAVNCPVENEVIVGLLSECQHVELLIVFRAGGDWYDLEVNDPDKFSNIFMDIDDERLVLLEDNPTGSVLQDWESSASGGMNMWTFAESVLFARQHGLFREPSQRWFICAFSLAPLLKDEGHRWYGDL